MPDRGVMVMLVENLFVALDIGKDQSSRTHTCLGKKREKRGKGAQGLGKAVDLVETDKKEYRGLWSYWLIHGINSILSQDVLMILFLGACIFFLHSLVMVLCCSVLRVSMRCLFLVGWLPRMQKMARARILHPRVLCIASEAIPFSCESVRIRCDQCLTVSSSSYVSVIVIPMT
jgi:hypothetical protein